MSLRLLPMRCIVQIGVLAFADEVQFPTDPCYSRGLSLATPANKDKLEKEFISVIQPSSASRANYSQAFGEAFRLLANDARSEPTNSQRSICFFCISSLFRNRHSRRIFP